MAASNRYRRPSTPNCSTFHSTTALASIPSILEYLTMPLNRIFTYTSTLTTLARYTSLTHPDHNGLTQALHQFEKLKKSWTEKIKDCSDHLAILEAYHTIALCPATVTPHRRLILRAPLVKVNLDDPSDISDQRIYYLCNDMLFFCRKKPKTLTLQCKGSLSLMQALVRPILPQLAAEMLQGTPWIRKPVFPSLTRRKKNAPSPTPPEHDKVVYGIEVLVPENNADYMAAFHQNYAGSGPVVRRRHVLRMQAREDQDTWLHHLQVVIQAVNKPPANIIS
ncbi:hypothetical protein BCR43DRAFT_249667 [Syncephalastrum racemosum]|uniref:DH domain-containing protein n=1 Tax=Syncephalastrum racemosum TaxID=13706 RepID=A0A1X2HFG6_SYNRA|nr:hypothetical protein BCR43DRAFT_249667 [Syncephalastrum racemosum]